MSGDLTGVLVISRKERSPNLLNIFLLEILTVSLNSSSDKFKLDSFKIIRKIKDRLIKNK